MAGTPTWRRVFDRLERAVGAPLEDVAASDRFVDGMAVAIKMRRAAEDAVWQSVHTVTGAALHAVNIPTLDDVRRLNTHLSTLAAEIREIERASTDTTADDG